MTKYLSRKLKFISLFAFIAVVMIHSFNFQNIGMLKPETTLVDGFTFCPMFEYFISNGLARFAVPLYFAISGYLFFHTFNLSKKSYLYKLKSRFFSLVVPFVIWTLLSGIFMLIYLNSNSLKHLEIVTSSTAYVLQNPVLGVLQWLNNPPAFQLWYISQLIVFTVISPLIYLAIKHTKGIVIFLFGILWLLNINFPLFNMDGLLFYSIGAYIALFNREDILHLQIKRRKITLITICWIACAFSKTLVAAANMNDNPFMYWLNIELYKLTCLLGLVAMWLLFDHIVHKIESKRSILLLTGHSFFIFVLHEPIMHLCFQFALTNFPETTPAHFILYIGLPFSIIAFSVILSMIVRKLCLPLHRILTGNRSN